MNWKELVGKKVHAFRGKWHNGKIPLEVILFDDGETFIEFREQSAYDYHDYSPSARNIELEKDAARWKEINEMKGNWGEANNLACPF